MQQKIIGEIIRTERLNYNNGNSKGINQLDLSLKIGWDNPSTLSRIEQGKVVPTVYTVIKILKALDVDPFKINSILVKAKYLDFSNVDTEYIDKIVNNTKSKFENSKYPVTLLIFNSPHTYFSSYMNTMARRIFYGKGIYAKLQKWISSKQDLVTLLFDNKYRMNKILLNWDEFTSIFVSNMHILYNETAKEKEQIEILFKFSKFKKFWEESANKTIDDFKDTNIPFIYKSPLTGKIAFNIQEIPIVSDQRFFIEQFLPMHTEDLKKLEEVYNLN